MDPDKESVESRIDVLKIALVSEENSALYYETLFEKIQGEARKNKGRAECMKT